MPVTSLMVHSVHITIHGRRNDLVRVILAQFPTFNFSFALLIPVISGFLPSKFKDLPALIQSKEFGKFEHPQEISKQHLCAPKFSPDTNL